MSAKIPADTVSAILDAYADPACVRVREIAQRFGVSISAVETFLVAARAAGDPRATYRATLPVPPGQAAAQRLPPSVPEAARANGVVRVPLDIPSDQRRDAEQAAIAAALAQGWVTKLPPNASGIGEDLAWRAAEILRDAGRSVVCINPSGDWRVDGCAMRSTALLVMAGLADTRGEVFRRGNSVVPGRQRAVSP
jgi:hypothetical protein